MKKLILLACAAGALLFVPAALAYFTQDTLPPTWHIHNGGTCSQCAGTAFFPSILTGGDRSLYLQDPAGCPDATDKAFLGGGEPSIHNPPSLTGQQPLGEGICMTSTTIIHLKRVEAGTPIPPGFSGPVGSPTTVNGRTFYTYYMLTSYYRGHLRGVARLTRPRHRARVHCPLLHGPT